ncbi:hypothetical protein [Ponticaulis profundi]|uniref:Alpha/beta hydrolase n=1 Tax=Ponticaulis profundi TaxID=2665222 RepID=A0ABW1SDC7_9PROT
MQTALKRLKAAADLSPELIKLEEDQQSKDLWVIFSHVDVPVGKFAQTRVFERLDGNKLFLNCRHNAWYTNGIDGFSSDIGDTIYRLKELVQPYNTCFVGHSMGAYLSLLCGNIIPNTRFIATSPELHLHLPGSRADRNGVNIDSKWASVATLSEEFHNHPNGQIYMGTYDPIDAYFTSRKEMISNMGDVYEVPHHHGVTEYFTSAGIYLDILIGKKEVLNSLLARRFLLPPNALGPIDAYEHFYKTFLLLSEDISREDVLNSISSFEDWLHPGWQEVRAKLYRKISDRLSSLKSAETAYFQQPNLEQFIGTYATSCADNRDYLRFKRLQHSIPPNLQRHRIVDRLAEIETKFPNKQEIINSFPLQNFPNTADVLNNLEPPRKPLNIDAILEAKRHMEWQTILELVPTNYEFRRSNSDHNVAVALLRALLAVGETGAIFRHSVNFFFLFPNSERIAANVLTAAIQLNSNILISVFLNFRFPHKTMNKLCGRLLKQLPNVSDHLLAADCTLFFLTNAEPANKQRVFLHQTLLKKGMMRSVCQVIIEKRLTRSIPNKNVLAFVRLFLASGYRNSAISWLHNNAEYFDHSAKSQAMAIISRGMLKSSSTSPPLALDS